MKAIIPIGGRGTRMRPLTFSSNKHFIPVGNKPLIHYPIETIVDAGIKQIAITYNPGQLEYAKKTLGDGSRWGVKLTYVLQKKPLGVANIFHVCEEWVKNEPFLLHLGDNIFANGIKDLVEYFKKEKPNGLVTMVEHPENWRLGVPYFKKDGTLTKYVEKPKNPPHNFAVPGLYFLDKNAFKSIKGKDQVKPSARGEYEIPDAYQWLIDHDYKVIVKEYKGTWLDPGKFNDWLETNQYLLDKNTELVLSSQPDDTSKVEGRVDIGENCVIENSTIRGPVSIGDHVIIKDSFIGPYTSIANHTHILDCKIENSVIMNDVTLKQIGGSIDNSIIGADSEISGKTDKHGCSEFFVGELSKISL